MTNSIRRFRFGFRLIIAFWQKHKLLIFLGIAAGIVGFASLSHLRPLFFKVKAQKIGLTGKYTSTELPLEIQQLLSRGLTTILPNGEATPSLASWQVGKEGKDYLFQLKDNLFWEDGKPISANQINYHFNDVAATALDQKTIKFVLKQPFVPFPTILAKPIFKESLVGNGDYRVKSLEKNGQVVEKLHLQPTKDQSKPDLIFRFYPTEKAAKTGFKLGEVDILREISLPQELENWPQVKITAKVRYNRFAAVFFNTREGKLADKSVRQALAYGINKQWQPRALSSFNPNSWAYNAEVKPYDFDPQKAQELLAKADEDQKLKDLELSTTPSLLSVAESIKSDWEKLNLEVKIKLINTLDEPFEALLVIQEIPADPDQYVLWHSTQAANLTRYQSFKLDKLLEDGRKTFEKEKRKAIYQDFQRFLVEDNPAIFLFHPTVYTVERK